MNFATPRNNENGGDYQRKRHSPQGEKQRDPSRMFASPVRSPGFK
jgi:hypothetical protein